VIRHTSRVHHKSRNQVRANHAASSSESWTASSAR
jgi:hypothetical protein